MSLLIKALKKAEQSKDAKTEANTGSGLTLELAPIEEKSQAVTPSLAEEAGLTQPEKKADAIVTAATIPSSDISKAELPAAAESGIASTMPEDDIAAALMEESGFSLSEEAGFSDSSSIKTAKSATIAKADKLAKPVKNLAQEPASERSASSTLTSAPASTDEQRSAAIGLLTTRNNKKRSPGNRRSLYLGLAGLVLLLGLGSGFYYYLQTLDQTQLVLMQPVTRGPVPQVTNATPASAPKAASPAVIAQAAPAPAQPVVPAAAPVDSLKPVDKPAMASAPSEEPMVPVAATQAAPIQKSARSPRKSSATRHPEMADSDSAMKVSRLSRGEPTVDSTQVAAYQAYQAGDDATASQLYDKLLQSDPRNTDILLGSAAVAVRQERSGDAANYYQRVLELDPNNGTAQEGLILLMGQANPTEAESRLKNLIAKQPDAAHLQAALGGIYTDQNRWPDAQQAYFKAFNLDPENADYAFNLAVSLDQLKKPELALNYYQQALALFNKQGGSIDKVALQNRINQLRAATAN